MTADREITTADVLGERASTSVTRQIIALAIKGGLRPETTTGPLRHGLYLVHLNAPGRDGLFGALHISAKNGNIVRANLCHGNWGQEKRYEMVAEIRTILKSWIAVTRPAGDER